MAQARWDWVEREDLITFLAHVAVGAMAANLLHPLAELSAGLRISIIALYLVAVVSVYIGLKSSKARKRREEFNERIATLESEHAEHLIALRAELSGWKRYCLLQSEMRQIVGGFLKERYKANHYLATALAQAANTDPISPNAAITAVEEWYKHRRAHIKDALRQLSNSLVKDEFGKPELAADQVGDYFKVSFYEVKKGDGEEYLSPLWRYYPAAGEPKTPSFKKGEGAAGRAWMEKEIQVCEFGGQDSKFTERWPGQKASYASMICVPAIEDIPTEKLSEVHGVLTIDTPIRAGYFQESLQQFWAFLMQPICSLIIYGKEVERVRSTLVSVIEKLGAGNNGAVGLGVGPVGDEGK